MIIKNMSFWGLLNLMCCKPKGLPYIEEDIGQGFSLVGNSCFFVGQGFSLADIHVSH
jgi:hypothetical protein